MTPTAFLRYVERTVDASEGGFWMAVDSAGMMGPAKRTIRVLQQWWESPYYDAATNKMAGEWRDVETVKE